MRHYGAPWWRMFFRFCFLVVFIISTHFCVHLLSCVRDYGWDYPLSPYKRSMCRRSLDESTYELSGVVFPEAGGQLSLVLPQESLQVRADEQRSVNLLNTVASGFEYEGSAGGLARQVPPLPRSTHSGRGHAGIQGKQVARVVSLARISKPRGEEEGMKLQDGMSYQNLFDLNTRLFYRLRSICSAPSSRPVVLDIRPDKGWRMECPDFWQCGKRFKGLAAVCLNSQGPFPEIVPEHLLTGDHPARGLLMYGEYFGSSVVLSNVYTNYHAQIFDWENLYLKGGCGEHFSNPLFESGSSNVTRFDVTINLAMGLFNYYHALIESVPKWAAMLPLLRSMPGVPVLVSRNDDVYRYVLQVLGIQSLDEFNVHYLQGQDDLVYANTMITPVNQMCGHSSVAAWEKIRRDYLHLERGEGSVFERVDDWWIVVGYRDTTRKVNETSTLLGSLTQAYGESRVKLFQYKDSMKRHLHFKHLRELFSKAVIYISPHGAGMSNMVFMPYGSSVIEIRPIEFSNSCYDNLASVLNFNYYLFYSPGGKNSTLTMQVDKVHRLVKAIVDAKGYNVHGETLSPPYQQLAEI